MEVFCSYAGLRKSIPCSSFHFTPSTCWHSVFTHTVDGIHFNQPSSQARLQILAVNNANCTLPKGYDGQTLQFLKEESSSKVHHVLSSSKLIESEEVVTNCKEECELHVVDVAVYEETDNASSLMKPTSKIDDKEIQRRRKIGLANKGRTPWNKGRTHSEETRKRISEKTMEALSDPKVRKKMSEHPRTHNDQSKARISSALRKIWKDRLQHKKLQQNFYLKWARSIAEAAKEGYLDQGKLQWDSYEKMMSNIISHYLHQKVEKARAKEIVKLRAEKAAKLRAEKAAAKLAQLWKEKEERAKERARKRSEVMKMKTALSKGKLKERLTKFHQRKRHLGNSAIVQREIAVAPQPVIGNLDIDLIKIEKMGRKISFAEQIQAVKSKRADFNSNTFAQNVSCTSFSEGEAGNS